MYHGKRVYLNLDQQTIAVKYGKKLTKNDQLTHLHSLGLQASSSQPIGIHEWHTTGLQNAATGADNVNNEIKKLKKSQNIEFSTPIFRGERNYPVIMTQDILVKFKPEYSSQVRSLLNSIAPDLSIVKERFGNMPATYQLHSASSNGFDVLASANQLVEDGYAEWAEPDMILSVEHESTPNDPYYPKLWGIHNTGQFGGVAGNDMKGDLAWNITTGSSTVKVMVIDCGVQQNHPDIHQVAGIDFTGQGGGGGPVNSCDNHGTAVAGCISGIMNNGIGIVGIAPSCYVISARTLVSNPTCDLTYTSQISWTVNALAYAGANGIRITNFSNQFFGTHSSALEAEYQYTHDTLNVIHFAAAGNGSTSVYYPASIPVVNAVGAMNSKGVLASFSNRGAALDFVAPGDSIWVTDRTGSSGFSSGDYYLFRGTSFASPYAAGVAALILSRFPTMTAAQVEAKMKCSSVDYGPAGYDTTYGWGFVNAYNAVRSSCIINPMPNITVSVNPGQCGTTVYYNQPTTSGNCSPVTCTPPSGSYFSVGTTTVSCSDTSGDVINFTVTVTGGTVIPGVLRDNFNRPNGTLLGSNKWALIPNSPSNGSLAIYNNQMEATNSAGNYNFGGLAWDTLFTASSEASLTLTQKSGVTTYSSLFIYARMNSKDYNTGSGYRLRYMEQTGADLIEIDKVINGYANTTVLASTNFEVNPGDVITFRILCDNQTMVALVNGNPVLTCKDTTYSPAQWYFAVRPCVFPTPVLFDNFMVSSVPPPPAPTLVAPVNNSINQLTTTTLSWSSSQNATTYRCQVATDSLFNGIILDDSTITTLSRQVPSLAYGDQYYWHVNSTNSSGTSVYSSTWNFTTVPPPPPPPVLASPVNSSLNQSASLTLSWNSSNGAATYRCQVATDSLFNAIILNDSTISSTSRQVSGLSNGTKYYWRVNAKNSGGTSSFSPAWNFMTIPSPPPTPVLATPATGSANQPTTIVLSWKAAQRAATYRIQVDTDSLFNSVVLDDSTVSTTSRQVSGLANATKYYWRVNATNAGGTSAFSSVWNFTTVPIPPSTPALVSPGNNSINQPTTITLTWNAVSGAATYRCQVATDSLFGSLVLDDSLVSTSSRKVGPLSGTTTYYWRISASNAAGSSAFSSPWNFTTTVAPPAPPVLASPMNNAVNQPTSLTLAWNSSAGASSYIFQVALDSLFNQMIDIDTGSTTSQNIGPLLNSTTYYWRVSAQNNGGSSIFSTIWKFTTIVPVPGTPVLQTPLNQAGCQSTALTLTWSSVSGAASYHVQLATDTLFTNIVIDDSSLSTTSRQVTNLTGNTSYAWRVCAKNTGGSGSFSPDWQFTTLQTSVLRDDFNRPNGPLAGSNKWALLPNYPSSGALAILNNQMQATSSAGNYNFGGLAWDTLMSNGNEASLMLTQKSGVTSNSSLFIYARMNNKDYNTGTGYRLRYMQQSGPDLIEIDKVTGGYSNTTALTSTNYTVNVGDVITFRILCDNKTMIALINGNPVLTIADSTYNPAQWYYAVLSCVFPIPVLFDNFFVNSQQPAIPPPAVPILASPANLSTNQPTTLTLTWNAASGATTYHCQVATDSLFSSPIVNDSSLSTTSRQIGPLTNGTTYYWHVHAINAGGISAFSTTWSFTTTILPPPAPILASPANISINQPTSLPVSWNASIGAASYRCQVATDSLFGSPILDDSTITLTTRQLNGLSYSTTYYWRVNAKNTMGTSAYSTVWNFTTIPLPPSIPILAAPTSGSVNQPTSLTLSWNASNGAVTYRCQVASDSLFNNKLVNDSTLTTLSRQVTALAGGTMFYWRVNAANAGGTSAFSTVWNFTTQVPPPTIPVLSSPTNNAINQPTSLLLNWSAATGAASYRCQLATDSLFTAILIDDSTIVSTSRQINGLVNNIKYYWRVNAKNSTGTSAYSTIWNFTTIPAIPAAPILATPSNGSINQPITLTLTWNASTGATTYRCQVATDSLFSALIVNDSTISTTTRQVGSLAGGTIYFWRVNASNAGGTSGYSTVWNFTTQIAPPSAPTLASPLNNSSNQPVSLTLNWNAASGAASYRCQVATDSLFTAILLDDSTIVSTSRQINGLVNNIKYYWHVNAKNTTGTSAYSTIWNFTTIPAIPAAPILATPSNGSINQPITLTLTWNASTGTSTYRCQVATDSLFSTLIVNDSTISTTTRQVGSLTGGTIYYWRVSASNAGGTSAFSSTWSFTTVLPAPAAPVLVSPISGSLNQATTLQLYWNLVNGATSYILQAASDSLFTHLVAVDTTSADSQRIGPLPNSTTYYWHVSAQNSGGTSAFSTTWRFTTVPAPPASPVLKAPLDLASCQPTTLTFSWSASSGATTYRFQLASDTLFQNIVIDDSSLTTPSRSVSNLNGNTAYSWKVSAKNAGGSSAFSTRWGFATFPISLLRDDFNRPDGPVAGSNQWILIQNQPSSGAMGIVNNAIQPSSSAGNTNFGGVAWDSLNTAGSEISFTLVQKSGNFSYSSFFLYAKMNNINYNTGVGYRLRYYQQPGTDIIEIHRVGTGYPNSTTLASVSKTLNINDVITFRVLCDNKTLVGLVNGVQVISVVDTVYMPAQWYFAVRVCVFSTPVRLDNFQMSPVEVLPAKAALRFDNSNGNISLPTNYQLEQNYPNPFNPTTTMRYSLPATSNVHLVIYNVLGQMVKTLVNGIQDEGFKEMEWNASNAASGVYFYRLEASSVENPKNSFIETRKLILIK
ncbi:MAG: fibronectin type III domain-containing protein [Bacteroidota bacterium]